MRAECRGSAVLSCLSGFCVSVNINSVVHSDDGG